MSLLRPFLLPDWRVGAVLALVVLLAGCSSGPSAPALDDYPIYKNSREGFRFSRPDGWVQRGRGEVPAGKVDGERLLVEYKCLTGDESASLIVTVASIAPADSLSDYVTKNTRTGEDWRPSGPAEEFTINGDPAVRIVYTMRGKKQLVREIVAFRRGERVYFFKGIHDAADTRARREIRSAVDTVVW